MQYVKYTNGELNSKKKKTDNKLKKAVVNIKKADKKNDKKSSKKNKDDQLD